jgi:hypothetical protein
MVRPQSPPVAPPTRLLEQITRFSPNPPPHRKYIFTRTARGATLPVAKYKLKQIQQLLGTLGKKK